MDLVLKNVVICHPGSERNGWQGHVHIQNNLIKAFYTGDEHPEAEFFEGNGCYCAPGFTDIFSFFGKPGYENRETPQTGAKAAAAGGFTRILHIPNTRPAIDNAAMVESLRNESLRLPVEILPIGALSTSNEEKDLAEMYDMHRAGAVAFSDGIRPMQNPGLLLKALLYLKPIGATLIQVPDMEALTGNGLVHESVLSTQMGLPGKPAFAEALAVQQAISLLEYTQGKLHLTGITTHESLQLVKNAKQKGLEITCSVTPYHLFFSNESLVDYDTNLKVNPPLRVEEDRLALIAGVLDGGVDCITSHHSPHDTDGKQCEFSAAKYGMSNIETAVRATLTAIPEISAERLTEVFSLNPANIFSLPLAGTETGSPAVFTLFDMDSKSTVDTLFSQGKNNAFKGLQLNGRIVGTYHKGLHTF